MFFQNENPYDPPSQAAWMDGSQDGYPAFEVEPGVTIFNGYGMGSYSYFNQGVAIENAEAFEAPATSGVVFNDILTVFLNGHQDLVVPWRRHGQERARTFLSSVRVLLLVEGAHLRVVHLHPGRVDGRMP